IHKPHGELRIQSQAVVARDAAPDLALLDLPWELARFGADGGAASDAVPAPGDFIYPTALVPFASEWCAWAREVFTPRRPLGEALLAFNARIHREFHYLPGFTELDTPLSEVWESRAGVCQDFAHFALACLRGIGLSAAYVSGYLL